MGEFKFGVLFNILVNRMRSGMNYVLMKAIFESMDSTIKKCEDTTFMNSSSQASKLKGGNTYANIPKPNRCAVRDGNFEQQLENIRTHVLPIIESKQINIEQAILQLLKDDKTIALTTHIGPTTDNKYRKDAILNHSLQFDELITASLRYTIANFEVYTTPKEEIIEYINKIYDLPKKAHKEDSRLFLRVGNRDRSIHTDNFLENKDRCKSYLKIGYLLDTIKDDFFEYREEDPSKMIIAGIDSDGLVKPDTIFHDDWDAKWKIENEDTISEIAEQIELLENEIVFLDTNSYKSFYYSIMDFYKKHNPLHYSLIIIGSCMGHNFEERRLLEISHINNALKGVVLNIDDLNELIEHDKSKAYHIEVRYEHIYDFLIRQGTSLEHIPNAEYINYLIDFFSDNCRSLIEAKNMLDLLIEQNKIVDNKEVLLILNAFDSYWKNIGNGDPDNSDLDDDEMYKASLKYRIWPFSLWGDKKLFDGICMDNIDIIVKRASTRMEAIKLSETSIEISKKLYKEREVQIFSRVAFEFSIASDKEFEILKKLLAKKNKTTS